MTRVGGSQVFFDVMASWNTDRLIQDKKTVETVLSAIALDAFSAVTGAFAEIGSHIDMITDATIDVAVGMEEARIQFEKFANEDNVLVVEQMNESIIALGESYAFSGQEAYAAASRMAQLGGVIGKTNVELGTQLGLQFSLIADMDTETGMRRLINLQQQTSLMYRKSADSLEYYTAAEFRSLGPAVQRQLVMENTTRVMDELNTIENRSAATLDQMTFAMNQFAAQAHMTGEEIKDMAAMTAILIEAGEQQGPTGRALKMMYARLGGDIDNTHEKLRAYGIEVTDANGNMRKMTDIMDNLNRVGWANSSQAVKQNIAQIVGGNRHYVRFIKMMDNYRRMQDLSSDATNDVDTAQEELQRRLESTAFDYQELTDEIENYNAKIGTELLPTMNEVLQAQKSFRQEALKFVSGDYGEGFATIVKMMVKMKGMGEIWAPILTMNLAVRSLAIGLGTVRSVMAGIRGELIAQTSYHERGIKIAEHGTKLNEAQKELMKERLEIVQSINYYEGQIKDSKKILSAMEEVEVALLEEKKLYAEQFRLSQLQVMKRKGEFNVRDNMERQHYLDIESKISGSMFKQLKVLTDINNMKAVSRALNTKTDKSKQRQVRLEGTNLDLVHRRHIAEMKTWATADKKIQKLHTEHKLLELQVHDLLAIEKRSDAENAILAQIQERRKEILRTVTVTDKKTGEEVQTTKGLLVEQKAIRYEANRRLFITDTFIQKKKIIKGLNADVAKYNKLINTFKGEQYNITQAQAEVRKVLKGLDEEEIARIASMKNIKEIILALSKKQLETERQIGVLGEKAKDTSFMHAMSSGKFEAGVAGFNTTMMGTGMILGMVSDSATATRLSMFAMTASMIPAIGTSAKMAWGMLKLAENASKAQYVAAGFKLMMGGVVAIVAMGVFEKMARDAEKLTKHVNDLNAELADVVTRTEALRDVSGDMVGRGVEIILGVDVPTAEEMATDALEGGNLIEQSWNDFMAARAASYENLSKSDQEYIDSAMKDLEIYYNHWMALQEHAENEISFEAVKKKLRDEMGQMETGEDWDMAVAAKKWGLTWEEGLMSAMTLGNSAFFTRMQADTWSDEWASALNEVGHEAGMFGDDQMEVMDAIMGHIEKGGTLSDDALGIFGRMWGDDVEGILRALLETAVLTEESAINLFTMATNADEAGEGIDDLGTAFGNATEQMTGFANAREELFFGGSYGNVTGSLYRQVVQQGVGTLYNKQEVIMSNNFHGFFNEQEAAERIITVLDDYFKGKI